MALEESRPQHPGHLDEKALIAWLNEQIVNEKRRAIQSTDEDVIFHDGMHDAYVLTLRWVTSGV